MSNISQKLDLRHAQTLVMTPQLQQAIKLLQMNNLELAAYVEAELAQNPLLEKADGESVASTEEAPAAPDTGPDEVKEEFDQAWTGNEAETEAKQEPAPPPDFDPGSSMASVGSGGSRSFDDPEYSLENTLAKQTTLREHLLEQLHMAFEDGRDRLIGAQMIDALDEGGYLRQGAEELAQRLGCTEGRVERLLKAMKQFSPTGIFACDLKECLTLQLEEQGKCDAPMRALLDHLDLLAAHDTAKLAKLCKVNETYLQDLVGDIRALNPRPASAFDHAVVQTAIPDVLMKRLPKSEGGGWRVELNAETLPRVLVNQTYYTEVAGHARDKKDKAYLSEQLQNAGWLVKALDQRAKTILKVAAAIIEHQDGFFLYGIEFLKPLTLKEIAGEIAMHESTVSRVTSNKYIGTPRGIFSEIFSAALGDGEGAASAQSVRARIKALVDAEDPAKILSDDKIMEILNGEGIEVARRTVAKYRDELKIPSSVQRRREKKAKRV